MASPPITSPLDELQNRPFAFEPAILQIEHNEWRMQKSTWSELLVANTGQSLEIWIPRRYVGGVSETESPIALVSLNRELEYRNGQLVPHGQRVIQMPQPVDVGASKLEPAALMPKAGSVAPSRLKLDTGESRLGKLILGALVIGVLACFALVAVFRGAKEGGAIEYRGVEQTNLGLAAGDNYQAVVARLGQPASERVSNANGELKYRILSYPNRSFYVVLVGQEIAKATYLGALDQEWRVIDAAKLHGGDGAGLLRSLKRN